MKKLNNMICRLLNKLKRHISVIDAIKHDVANRMHFDDYEMLRKYRGQDKDFANRWINTRINHYVKTGEFDNQAEINKKLFKNGGKKVHFILTKS